ncbi:MAG: biotin--[acetyl-CoA-carboxylase] ligase [bacterium]
MTGQPFIILDTTESTNNHAINQARSGTATDGTVYFAIEQTKGKGQRAKIWHSTKAENLILSTIQSNRGLKLQHQFLISCATTLACLDLVSTHAGDDFRIKWPNDLYWRDRKAGGILIENIIKGNSWEKAIIGIGININQTNFPEMSNYPVSLKQISGKTFDPIDLAKELCGLLEHRLAALETTSADKVLAEYNAKLYKHQETTRFKKGNMTFDAMIKGVNQNGQLILKHSIEEEVDFGEVEWVL